MRIGNFALNANLYIFIVVGGFFLLAFLFGEARLKRIALAVIAGLFAADQLTQFAMTQASGVLKLTDPAIIQMALLLIVAVPLSIGKSVSVGGHFSVRNFILALLLAVTVVAYTQSYLPAIIREQMSTDFNLVAIAVNNKLYWLSGLLAWLILLSIWKKKPKLEDDKKGKKGKKKR